MNHSNHTATAAPLGRRSVWLGLLIALASWLGWSSHSQGRDDEAPPHHAAPRPAALAATRILFRGPEHATVGQRFTLEVLLWNTGSTPLKNLEFVAQLDAHLEQASKAREQRVTVEAIAPDDLHIVRLTLTPRKNGAGGLDVTLRGKDGATTPIRYVLPVVSADLSTPQPAQGKGASPLRFTITPLQECFADRPGIFLVHVLNTDTKPMPAKLDLILAYSMVTETDRAAPGIGFSGGMPQPGHKLHLGGMGRGNQPVASNPVRQVRLSLPALAAGEARTLPVRLTPRRIGELQIAISAAGNPPPGTPLLGSASLQVRFDPKAAVAQLLPVRTGAAVPSRLPQRLADVPEVSLEDSQAKGLSADEAFEHVAHLIEKIKHVNGAKTDAYMEALVAHRSDVRGLPFTLGGACRLPAERGQHFVTELTMLRAAMGNPAGMASRLPNPTAQPSVEAAIRARVAALVQVIGPEGAQLGREMVKYLATLSHVEATRALAKLAIFAEEEPVRRDALAALTVRRDKDCTDILVSGLNYPWPPVAKRAAEAIVHLKRTDFLLQLVETLERPDPRAPQLVDKGDKQVAVVQELVRVNHLRNCLLCHAPASPVAAAPAVPGGIRPAVPVDHLGRGESKAVGPVALTAPVPLPGQTLPTPSPHNPYGQFSMPETAVAFDVTYLRQDFSVKLPVAGAQPWPEQQRFDFLVRTRLLTEKEAAAYRELLLAGAGGQSPYQLAALGALRQLTGQDTDPTAAAWRRLLAQRKTAEQ